VRPPSAASAPMRFAILHGHPVDAVVTDRSGGVSEGPYASLNLGLHVGDEPDRVLENRRRAAALVGLGRDDLVLGAQTHSAGVALVTDEHRGRGSTSTIDALPDVDALVTTTPGIGLTTLVADCVPIVLFDPRTRALACIHAGWRGTVARIVTATIERMVDVGARPGDLLAGIGPAITADHYPVGPEVVAAVTTGLGPHIAAGVVHLDAGSGQARLDLAAATRALLVEAGVGDANIEAAPQGTGPGTTLFSDRDERPCGRFALIARLSA